MPQALIVEGGGSESRRDFAQRLVMNTFCVTGAACGTCDQCVKIKAGSHPDFFYIGDDALKVDRAREIIRQASQKPSEAECQIFVIDNADNMRPEAQNALLKVIEEPQSACFVFLCLSRLSLLPTVRSRCAVYSLRAEEAEENPEIAEMCSAFPAAMGDEHSLIMFFSKAADLKRQDFAVFLLCCKKEVHHLLLKGENTDVLLKIYDLICSFEDDLQYNPNLFALCCTLSGHMWEILKKQKG